MSTRDLKLGFIVAALSTVIAVYGVEVGLFAWAMNRRAAAARELGRVGEACPGRWMVDPHCRAAFAAGEPFDSRETVEVLADLEGDGSTWWPALHASFLRSSRGLDIDGQYVIPLAGISNANTLLCNESGDWVTFRSDEYGFNNPAGLHREGAPLVIIGDSFVHGHCVAPENTIAAVVRDALPGTLGLGLAGAGPLTELAILREYAAPLRPAHVVWAYFGANDLKEFSAEMENVILRSYLDGAYSQDLLSLQEPIDSLLSELLLSLRTDADRSRAARNERMSAVESWPGLGSALRRTLTLRELRRVWRRATRRRPVEPFPAELLRQVLRTARDEVASWGGEFVVLLLPEWARYGQPEAADPHYEDVKRLVDELDLAVIDLVAGFEAHPDPLSLFPFRVPGHYTEEGNRIVAEAILEKLDQIGLPPDDD